VSSWYSKFLLSACALSTSPTSFALSSCSYIHDVMCYTFLKPTTSLAWSTKHYRRDPITLKSCGSPSCHKGKTRLHNYDHCDISIIYVVKEILMNFHGKHRHIGIHIIWFRWITTTKVSVHWITNSLQCLQFSWAFYIV
jgi:hypothetical protein